MYYVSTIYAKSQELQFDLNFIVLGHFKFLKVSFLRGISTVIRHPGVYAKKS